ncbi:winged helix-turn-helix domain-containing protein [Falsigemmobacter faecalis]|uniref:DNA-binding response regulator n=1 Tax=Falsigemmobacter faecalis TaxID=2488730 RepID=A0A3P3DSX1_9RHOB|nr:response regulator transcription factor [Falsigemmobacter faecalis]RRH75778.1 DNA-binding response regulator [Falsigemmobacter faecalis]
MRVLCVNPSALPLTTASDPSGLMVEAISEKALFAGAAALRENRLLPVFLVGRADGSDVLTLKATLQRLRATGFQGPVLVICGAGAAAASLLNAGADDVLAWPASGADLMARLNAVMRRIHGVSRPEVQIGSMTFHLDGRHPEIGQNSVRISRREYEILQFLALNAGRVVSKAAIYDALYSLSAEPPFEKIIDVYICRLRTKLARDLPPGEVLIETVAGRGYRLPPAQTLCPDPALAIA